MVVEASGFVGCEVRAGLANLRVIAGPVCCAHRHAASGLGMGVPGKARATLIPCSEIAMANLTLSIDDELLQRAREAALRERTTVNALVREFLQRYADARRQRLAAIDALDAVAGRIESGSTGSWTREALHER